MSRIESEMHERHFRVVVFGSARIKPGTRDYNRIYSLARMIGEEGMDLVTGGGPGLMDAAMSGHFAGKKDGNVHGIGLQIRLPKEQHDSRHLDIKQEFSRFSQRLDTFMVLANVVVVAPGGVGTMLELLYTWQLMQVHHTCKLPIVLLGDMWPGFLSWVKRWPLQHGLLDEQDLELLHVAKNCRDAMKIIRKAHELYRKHPGHVCLNVSQYGLQEKL